MSMIDGFIKGFKDFGHLINTIINSVLLAIVYFIGVGPTSVIAKLFKKNFLSLNESGKTDTYWIDCELCTEEEETYYRQF